MITIQYEIYDYYSIWMKACDVYPRGGTRAKTRIRNIDS